MLYLFLTFLVLVLCYLAYTSPYKQHCLLFVRLAFLIVFFIYGFEYFNTVDYGVMLSKFNYVNYNISISSRFGEEIEPFVALLMKICKPIGNIGFYVVVALFEVVVLYKIVAKYVPLKYLWLFFVLLLINFDNVILIMTTKRQILSLFIVWSGVYILLDDKIRHKYLMGISLFIGAIFIHTAAIFALLMLPIIKYNFRPSKKLRLLLFFLFFVQFVIDVSAYSESLYTYIFGINEKFASYAHDLQGEKNITITYFLYYLTIYTSILLTFDKLNSKELVWAKFVIVYYLLFNLLPYSAGRSLMYFNLCQLFVIPFVISKLNNDKIKKFVCTFVILISIRLCYNTYTTTDPSGIGNGFKEFNTIFEAPSLQIDKPNQERSKIKDLREKK